MSIEIEEKYINRVMTAIGYPLVTIELTELAVGGDAETGIQNLKDLCIEPAMREYFQFFPLIESRDYNVGTGPFDIPFPIEVENIFNALVKLNNSTASGTTNGLYSNVFSNAKAISTSSSNYLGSGFDYGIKSATYQQSVETKSALDTNKAFRWDVNIDTQNITGYNNSTGKIVVDYCSFSDNFNSVKFELQEDVIKLAQANLLEILATIRGQLSSETPNEFNYDLFFTKATDMRTVIRERFQDSVQSIPIFKY